MAKLQHILGLIIILDIDKIERYGQIFDALATSSRVKKLILHCALQDGLTDEDLYKFASALEENKSLEELCLQGNTIVKCPLVGYLIYVQVFIMTLRMVLLQFCSLWRTISQN